MDFEDGSIDPTGKPDEKAIGELLAAPLDEVHRYLTRKNVEPVDAWDIIQETFLFAYNNFDRHDQTKSLKAWVTGIAINKLRDYRKVTLARRGLAPKSKKDREPLTEQNVERRWEPPPVETDQELLRAVPSPPRDPLKRPLRKEAKMNLYQALGKLNPDYAEAVILHHIHGYSHREIAEMIGAPAGTIPPRVKRGLAGLRKLLKLQDVEDLL